MLYFLPAWYEKNSYRELEQAWHTRRMHTEFDDTVKQVQLFNRNKLMDYKILLLSYTPNFRHFLHRQGVFHAPYWSCFDCIQQVKRKSIQVFSFHNLSWPEDIEFVYTPFVVCAFLKGEKYAQIEFGEAGNPIAIDMYEKGEVSRRNIYDDRGFVSSTAVFSQGQLEYTDYLTEKGIRKFRHFAADGHVEINPKSDSFYIFDEENIYERKFLKQNYDHIEEMLLEVFMANMEKDSADSIYCVAMHRLNVGLVRSLIDSKRVIMSFYGERHRMKDNMDSADLVKKARYLITDSEATSRYLQREVGQDFDNLTDLTPYDSRVDFGISQQLTVQNILVPVDDLPDDRFSDLIAYLAMYLSINELAMVHLFTRNASFNLPDMLLEKVANILEEKGMDRRMAIAETKDRTAENDVDAEQEQEAEEVPMRFFVDQCVDELAVSRCMREQRIMVDMRHNPDLFLQINCISAGIPQVVRRETNYVKDGKNGIITRDISYVPAAVEYFLDSLNNWNQAKIYSYELGQEFTTKKIVEKWKKVLEAVEK